MKADRSNSVVRRYFAGLAEQTFHTRFGVADPPLIDYVSDLLVRFVRTDAVFRLLNTTGRRLTVVADMLAEAEARIGEARREAHRQIGDFTLFWSGVYPEALKWLQSHDKKDHLLDYRAEGSRAYFIASKIPASCSAARAEVLERLSDQFDLCAYALGEIRREWEQRDENRPPGTIWIN